MDIKNLVIDRILRGVMVNTDTDEVMWSINQIENPSLTVSSETADAVDAMGVPIVSFDRAKSAEFSAENSLLDLGLMAAQSGSEVEASSATVSITTPCFQEFAYATTVTLSHTPDADGVAFIYQLNGDGTLGKKFAKGSAASATEFAVSGTTLTMPTDESLAGSKFLAIYNYEADNTDQAIAVANSASTFPKAGKFIMEILGADVCNPSVLYYAYLIFPQAKLTSDFDLSFGTDMKHPFTIKAMQQYCDAEKRLYSIVIPDAAD